MSSTDQSGYTGRHRTEPDGHYHDGSFYTDDECGCELARIARLPSLVDTAFEAGFGGQDITYDYDWPSDPGQAPDDDL